MYNVSERMIFHRLKGLISPSLLTKWWKVDPELYINEETHHFKQDRALQTIDLTRLKQAGIKYHFSTHSSSLFKAKHSHDSHHITLISQHS
ncbi:hypothetical protein BSAF29S_00001 [Bacillus safensis subsp. safensis]